MKRSSASPGPVAYAVVLTVLAAYFVWLLLEMAGNEKGGMPLLGYLAIGLAGATIAPLLLAVALGALERRIDARQQRSKARTEARAVRHTGPHPV